MDVNLPTTKHKSANYQPSSSFRGLELPNQRHGKNKNSDIRQHIRDTRHEVLGSQIDTCAMDCCIPESLYRHTLKDCDQIVRESVRADDYSRGKQSVFEPSLREDSAVEEKE